MARNTDFTGHPCHASLVGTVAGASSAHRLHDQPRADPPSHSDFGSHQRRNLLLKRVSSDGVGNLETLGWHAAKRTGLTSPTITTASADKRWQ
jgi:hypothetical protein